MITRLADLLIGWLADAGPGWVLVASALLTAVMARVALAVATPRRADARARRMIFGALLGAWLHRSRPRVVGREVGRLAAGAALLLAVSLPALLLLVPPGAALLLALEQRYEHAPAAVGDAVVVTAEVPSAAVARRTRLRIPDGLAIERTVVVPATNGDPARRVWRVRVIRAGVHDMAVRPPRSKFEYIMPLVAAPDRPLPTSRVARDPGLLALFDPQPALGPADQPLQAIRVQYAGRDDVGVLGWRFHWLVPWLVLTFALVWLIPGRPPLP